MPGLPDINIEDLKANTEYHKYSVTSLQIVWYGYKQFLIIIIIFILCNQT